MRRKYGFSKPILPKLTFPALVICCLIFSSDRLLAQVSFIAANNLTPFQPRNVGTTSDVKTVRLQLTYARALSSIAVAPGFTEFTTGSVSGCAVDGHTVNPALSACVVSVTFSPKYPGLRTAPLIATDSTGAKSSIGLQGTGLSPRAAIIPGISEIIAGVDLHAGYSGDGGPATEAMLQNPQKAVADAAGNLYIADTYNYRVRKVDTSDIIRTIAGNGTTGPIADGGLATDSAIFPSSIAVDGAGNLYISDTMHSRVRKVDSNGIITRVAGDGTVGSSGDGGQAFDAKLNAPFGMATDSAGNLYIADSGNNRIRKVDTAGIISTAAGSGPTSSSPCIGSNFAGDGGPATDALLCGPLGVFADVQGDLYIADTRNYRIRKVGTDQVITTVAGNGKRLPGPPEEDGKPAVDAALTYPLDVALDAAENLYIADLTNGVRRVDISGIIHTLGKGDAYSVAVNSLGNPITADEEADIFEFDLSQSAVFFDPQNVGTASDSEQVVLSNTGNQHIDLGGVTVTGDFDLLSSKDSDCTEVTELGAGFSCALRITFNPAATGTRTGSATFTDNSLDLPGTTQTISLHGYGTTP